MFCNIRNWRQHKCPSNALRYKYPQEYYIAIKKEEEQFRYSYETVSKIYREVKKKQGKTMSVNEKNGVCVIEVRD